MRLLGILFNLFDRLFYYEVTARPPDQLLGTGSSDHCWWGVQLDNDYKYYDKFFHRELIFGGQTLSEVSAFLARCQYVSDLDQFLMRDWWVHPADFEQVKKGDCEDHALWAWRVLHERGYDVRLMLGHYCGSGHAWVQVYADGKSYILEATAKHNVDPRKESDYAPERSIKRTDDGCMVMFGHAFQTIQAFKGISTEPLSRPEHWVRIDRLIFAGLKSEAHAVIRRELKGEGGHTQKFLDRYFYLREQSPESFELDDEAYWAD